MGVDRHGDWENRSISLWGVAAAFISQLRIGQEMTKISIPAAFLRPNSALEEIGSRMLGDLHMIVGIEQEPSAEERMRRIAAWVVSTARTQNFNHKPFNPVLGEEHKARREFAEDTAFFVSEQVEHHPPVSAFQCVIKGGAFMAEGNSQFSVTFNGNSVSIHMSGGFRITITLPSGKQEVYELPKGAPDVLIQNIIWGTKHAYWDGPVSINCPSTGYSVKLNYRPDTKHNVNELSGTLRSGNNVLYYIRGQIGREIYISKDEKFPDRIVLCNTGSSKASVTPIYPEEDKLPPNASLRLWRNVADAIVHNRMAEDDAEKRRVEEEQRAKRRTGQLPESQYFKLSDSKLLKWEVANPDWFESSR